MEEFPASKIQLKAVGPPVDRSVKLTVSGAGPVLGVMEKSATRGCGAEVTLTVVEAEVDPFGPVTVRVGLKIPAVV